MKTTEQPHILEVKKVDNAAEVTFNDGTTTIYPASLLNATKELADIMYEVDRELSSERTRKSA
jgi:hypothetical protein